MSLLVNAEGVREEVFEKDVNDDRPGEGDAEPTVPFLVVAQKHFVFEAQEFLVAGEGGFPRIDRGGMESAGGVFADSSVERIFHCDQWSGGEDCETGNGDLANGLILAFA